MTYVEEHAGALEAVMEAGAMWTFTLSSPGTPQPQGGFTGATTTTVTGYAIRVKGEGEDQFAAWQDGETTERHPMTLFFVPGTYGQVPPQNSIGRSGSTSGTVKKVRSVAPDGVAIASYVVLE